MHKYCSVEYFIPNLRPFLFVVKANILDSGLLFFNFVVHVTQNIICMSQNTVCNLVNNEDNDYMSCSVAYHTNLPCLQTKLITWVFSM